ncbi:hypothetical protein CHLRE_09g402923v5 [Chlamydomonas reinhardtii]|uniref:SGNH hydrolase-type esterase domain-containing protein n=1 Tax=Chlamydomonas reinhardtii TaxID=3055 RepID=A0A2K3DF56_CHLRE|nr:uncharacterized protein CHLRE_09g402923v5 [Chlamydomonas reinhardtii]PNW79166.1 hypothetical protein CHLRE_09g402923v5 [Chlamydomonas reinhardtii]
MRRSGRLLALALATLLLCADGWLSGEWLGNDPWARTKHRPEFNWKWRWAEVKSSKSDSHPKPQHSSGVEVRANLQAALDSYEYTLPLTQLRRGVVYTGSANRLRRVLHKAATDGASIKVAAIGGSISWGHGASQRGETDWFSVFSRWLIDAFPRASVVARNGCTPGVPTPYMIMCLEASVDPDTDLVFVEYTLNDAHSLGGPGLLGLAAGGEGALYGNRIVKDAERLLRRLLVLPNRPAVVFMHTPPVGLANYPKGHPKNPLNKGHRPFYMTSEDAQGALAQYYDVQYLSLRTAVYRLAVHTDTPGFRWEDVFIDHHPGDHGHKIMSDLAVHLLQRTAHDLLQLPYGAEDEHVAGEPLPPPMYPGNVPPDAPMCRVGDLFRAMVKTADGFTYVNEGTAEKPKPGYVATKPGSVLRIAISTDRSPVAAVGAAAAGSALAGGGGGGIAAATAAVAAATAAVLPNATPVHVYLHHLRSYTNMGVAKFRCVSGCRCKEVEVDAHHDDHTSQVFLAGLEATQAPDCIVEVKVLDKTSSGGNKFKVSGVVVAERPGAGDALSRMGTGHGKQFGLAAHADEEAGAQQLVFTSGGGSS